jgi:mono/diheme cytochrome c family protein
MLAFETPGSEFPLTLDETRVFEESNPDRPVFGLTPYDVNTPLWTDGAHKSRWVFLPPDERITMVDQKPSYPVGSLFIKHFKAPSGEPIETRIIAKKADQKWYFGTYVWEDGQATLSRNPRSIEKEGVVYRIPSEKECQLCHNAEVSAEPVMAFQGSQLKSRSSEDVVQKDQLKNLRGQSLFSAEVYESFRSAAPLDSPSDESISLERRARAYLAVNCSSCHQPAGAAKDKKLDLRLETSLADTNLVAEGKVKPGKPLESLLIQKFTSSVDRMPPLSLRHDPVGNDLLLKWVTEWPGSQTP